MTDEEILSGKGKKPVQKVKKPNEEIQDNKGGDLDKSGSA